MSDHRSREGEEKEIVACNTLLLANEVKKYSCLKIALRKLFKLRREEELVTSRKERSKRARREELLPRRGKHKPHAFATDWHTCEELAVLIFQPLARGQAAAAHVVDEAAPPGHVPPE